MWWDRVASYPLVFVKRGEDGDGKEGSKIPVGGERVEITWSLLCR